MASKTVTFAALPDKFQEEVSNKPQSTPFHQQRMKSYKITCNSFGCVSFFLLFGLLFVPLGVYFEKLAAETYEQSIMYDGSAIDESSSCVITEGNSGSTCEISVTFDEDVTGPMYVYYEIHKFYQNHRTYTKSRSSEQLMGENLDYDDVYSDCYPLITNGSTLLNPCGLIANTFFNDVIEFDSSDSSVEMDTEGIAWSADKSQKFQQVYGFKYELVTDTSLSCSEVLGESSCETYYDSSTDETYYYYYPDNDSVQYLYETYDDIISPIKGVTDEHFINWMTTAGLPRFRKLYGKIDQDITAGTTWTFNMTLNFEVRSYGASKSLVLTNLANDDISVSRRAMKGLGYLYLAVGAWSLSVGFLLALYLVAKASY